ncbi:hypothetical protein IWW51_003198 [Coemansia sp. RSA 2702]|nr:hypothetical protein IWW51_003198 [Coemansia sp. RSA 2702]
MAAHTGSAAIPADQVHVAMWALGETHLRRAQAQSKQGADGWKAHVVAGLACLYGVLRLCGSASERTRRFGAAAAVGADTEAKTRLRIAQVLGDWGDDAGEEERQLQRALLATPGGDAYAATRYAIVLAHSRMLARRGEGAWAAQRLRAAGGDAQQRRQHAWAQRLLLELANVCARGGDTRGAQDALQAAGAQAQQAGDAAFAAAVAVQQLALLVQQRDWAAAAALGARIESAQGLQTLGAPNVRVRFWVLRAAVAAARGTDDDASARARDALAQWQGAFARLRAGGGAADGGAQAAGVCGWSYYEAHAWAMLAAAGAQRGDGAYARAAGFLRLALEGVARGEADGLGVRLRALKAAVLLRVADANVAALFVGEARRALGRALASGAEKPAAALRWAMCCQRAGDVDAAAAAYACAAARGTRDVRVAALASLAVLAPARWLQALERETVGPGGAWAPERDTAAPGCDRAWAAALELARALACAEPVRAKAHVLACLRLGGDAALQGWALCALAEMVLRTGQYDHALKTCAAAQAIAQGAGDALQNAAAVGILARIEGAVGDAGRHAQLRGVARRLLQQFNGQISTGEEGGPSSHSLGSRSESALAVIH